VCVPEGINAASKEKIEKKSCDNISRKCVQLRNLRAIPAMQRIKNGSEDEGIIVNFKQQSVCYGR
jgi:hypothetical protein